MATILPFPKPDRPEHTDTRLRMDTDSSGAAATATTTSCMDVGSEHWGDWMLLAQEGDRDAYQSLLRAITPYLRAIARRYLGHGEDCEDAVQEILLVLHDIRHTYEYGRPFKPWLSTIASRRSIDLLRRRSRRLKHETAEHEDPYLHVADHASGPQDRMLKQHASDTLHQAIAGLTPRQQEAIRLLRLKELSLDEASLESRQSVGALKVACHRAMKTLRQSLAKRGSA